MKKPWSITTTLRNPERLRDFLIVLKKLEGEEWNLKTQDKYQILLIQHRTYGYGNIQFYKRLSKDQISLIDNLSKNISFKQAEDIYNSKNYKDSAMRGRQSINPLKKFGLVTIKNKKIYITDVGYMLLKDDYDLGETFFRSFLKWQIPNPDNNDYKIKEGYNIKPFIGTLHLINAVNEKSILIGEKPKGISKQEFSLFATTLVNYKSIKNYADKIIDLRNKLKGKTKQEQRKIFNNYRIGFAKKFLKTTKKTEINKLGYSIILPPMLTCYHGSKNNL